jgi:flagellar biosynthesis protein FlhF
MSSSLPQKENNLISPKVDTDCISFVADTHFEAVRKIQAEIGLDALVVHSRQIPASGFGRLWKKPKVELIVKPKSTPSKPKSSDEHTVLPLAPNNKRPAILNVYDSDAPSEALVETEQAKPSFSPIESSQPKPPILRRPQIESTAATRCETFLRKIGLDELVIAKICDEAAIQFKSISAPTNRELLDFCRTRFGKIWQFPKSSYHCEDRPVVLLGAPGSGKTTLIGKWVSLLSLKAQIATKIWKLDGLRANTDEFLDLIAELHQVPLLRFPETPAQDNKNELLFIDIPGVDWNDPSQLQSLKIDLQSLPPSSLYLVLNAAYDNDILKRQIRAYSNFPIDGLILTHLDEEKRWSKILNVTIGTNFPLKIVSGGQNIPGFFQATSSEDVLSHVFPANAPPNPES